MMCFFNKNKKGNIQDLVFISVFIISLIMVIVLGFKIFSEFNSNVQAATNVPTEAKTVSNTITQNYPKWLDTAFLLFWLVTFFAAVISAWFIDINPVFFIFFLILLIGVYLALIPINNFLETMFSNVQLTSAVAEFPILLFFIGNYYKIAIAQGFIITIMLFAKTRSME